ncbi:signal peptidase I [Enterococcus sp. HY326]|uniref:signal peptidase I n=1 Tax=Enterococcus sp. HY326 TaxID=2971265 RepID=UPI00223F30D6|nr:signal peptidase I [Enterococcus sp. HY326]
MSKAKKTTRESKNHPKKNLARREQVKRTVKGNGKASFQKDTLETGQTKAKKNTQGKAPVKIKKAVPVKAQITVTKKSQIRNQVTAKDTSAKVRQTEVKQARPKKSLVKTTEEAAKLAKQRSAAGKAALKKKDSAPTRKEKKPNQQKNSATPLAVKNTTAKKRTQKQKKRQNKKQPQLIRLVVHFKELLLISAGTLLVFVLIGSFFITITRVNGFSMIPTLRDGDTVIVHKTTSVRRMDLVVIQRGNTQQVRRVIGLPGEDIAYVDDELYVNDSIISEPFIIDEINESLANGGNYTTNFRLVEITGENRIPDNCYLVLGDNRSFASDSRQYGLIDTEQILGVVKMRLLPINDLASF